MPCEYIVHVLFAHNIMLRTGTMIRAKPREACTFTVSGLRRELVKAKNISVKRVVPLLELKSHLHALNASSAITTQ